MPLSSLDLSTQSSGRLREPSLARVDAGAPGRVGERRSSFVLPLAPFKDGL